MAIKPIALKDIVLGRRYVEMVVCIDGRLVLETYRFFGRPIKSQGSLWLRTTHKKSRDLFLDYASASDLGLVTDSKWGDNYHRVFRYNASSRRVLGKLVKHQNLKGYAKLIGVDFEMLYDRLEEQSMDTLLMGYPLLMD